MIRFGRYQLDATQGLRRGAQEVRLTPKSLAVLAFLADRPGRIVTKDELFAAVWPDTAVTDAALATCVQEIRRALDDDARRPRFIETIHRRGYRFIGRASTAVVPPPDEAALSAQDAGPIGRDADIGAVLAAYADAQRGVRRICLISGESGVGKTALFRECLARMARAGAQTTVGHCVEYYGSGEPYEPLLDALMRLCSRPGGDATIRVLERYSPTWLAQLPGLLAPRQAARLQRLLPGTSRDRMIRELNNAVDTLASEGPLVIGIEDLHWSDPSTLDWLSAVASRPDPARLVVLATLRPPGANEGDGPLAVLRETLLVKRLGIEVALGGLDAASVVRYVFRRVPPMPGRELQLERLAQRLGDHTGGNPLFLASVLDQLVARGVIADAGDGWSTSDDVDLTKLGVPATIRPVIDRRIAALAADDRSHLETASVVGERFSIAVVSRVDDVGAEDIAALPDAPNGGLVRHLDGSPSPDQRTGPELRFAHTLYRDAVYDGIPSVRRARLHRQVAAELQRAWGKDSAHIAAELALHCERGGDMEGAIEQLWLAAETARRRGAFREAKTHYEHALSLLERLTDDPPGAARELPLRMGLGAAIMAVRGFGDPGVEAAYSRARLLAQGLPASPEKFPASWGLWLFYWGRGEVETAAEVARELRALAADADPGIRLQALHASWATAFSQGDITAAVADSRDGWALYERGRDAPMAATYGSHDAGVCASMFSARALALAGLEPEAVDAAEAGVRLARELDHPFSLALSLTFRAAVEQARLDPVSAAASAQEAIDIASEQGFGLMLAWCTTIAGWAAVRLAGRDGHAARAGIESLARGIDAARATGSDQFQPFLLGMEADACLAAGLIGRGRRAAADGLAAARRTGERFHEPELLRLSGELLLAGGSAARAAEAGFVAAIDLASAQGAAGLALRSAIRLAELGESDRAARLAILRQVLSTLPDGLGGAEATRAAALLES